MPPPINLKVRRALWITVAAAAVGAAAGIGALLLAGRMPRGALPGLSGPLPDGDRAVELPSNGYTRYRLALHPVHSQQRQRAQRLVVLVPGISYPMDCMKRLFYTLEQAGFSVLLYDVTGRGFSHSSGEPMTIRLYVRQLEELLTKLDLWRAGGDGSSSAFKLHLVGWSMGAVIATHFARVHPNDVGTMCLLAPPGGAAANKPLQAKLLGLPLGIGRAVVMLFVKRVLKKLYREELSFTTGPLLDTLIDHAERNPGLARAVVSTLVHCPELDNNIPCLQEIGAHPRPVLVMWGDRDVTIGAQSIAGLMKYVRFAPSVCRPRFGDGSDFFVILRSPGVACPV